MEIPIPLLTLIDFQDLGDKYQKYIRCWGLRRVLLRPFPGQTRVLLFVLSKKAPKFGCMCLSGAVVFTCLKFVISIAILESATRKCFTFSVY